MSRDSRKPETGFRKALPRSSAKEFAFQGNAADRICRAGKSMVLPIRLYAGSAKNSIPPNGSDTSRVLRSRHETHARLPRPGPFSIGRAAFRLRNDCPADKNTKTSSFPMTSQSLHPDIVGTRTGHAIQYTCPVCSTDSSIVNKTPRDHFKEARVVSCRHCRTRLTVLTPGHGR
jgi:hypothetical protein